MLNAILGTKLGQTQAFTKLGERIPATVIKAGPCVVVQIKTQDKDGYHAVQLGFGETKKINKALKGRLSKSEIKTSPRFFGEVRLENAADLKLGQEIKVGDIFKPGDVIDVIGVSKGKGFMGVVKRWGFAGGPRTHGQSDRERAPGSIGATTTPGRVLKGKKMAGRTGGERKTMKNLEVVEIDSENNLLKIKGLVPGFKGGLLTIKKVQKTPIKEGENHAN